MILLQARCSNCQYETQVKIGCIMSDPRVFMPAIYHNGIKSLEYTDENRAQYRFYTLPEMSQEEARGFENALHWGEDVVANKQNLCPVCNEYAVSFGGDGNMIERD